MISKRLRTRMAATACGLGLAASMLCPATVAFAEDTKIEQDVRTGKTGTTNVRVRADEGNMKFSVPTVIPFSADAAGELTGPAPEEIQIRNLSAYRIHLENMVVEPSGTWNLAPDAGSTALQDSENNIYFMVGPEGSMQNAMQASEGEGIDLSGEGPWELSYMGDKGKDAIDLHTTGTIGKVTNGNIGVGTNVAQITWTLGAGGAAR